MTEGGLSVFIGHVVGDPDWPDKEIDGLAGALETAGAQVLLDLRHERVMGRKLSEREWRDWMRTALERAQRILLLVSSTYTERVNASDASVPVGRGVAFESARVEQWLYDHKQHTGGRIWVLLAEGAQLPRFISDGQPIVYGPAERERLVQDLAQTAGPSAQVLRRRLRHLLEAECVDLYVPLAGRLATRVALRLPQSVARFVHREGEVSGRVESAEHLDVLDAVGPKTRALVEGEPGAGKTFAMLRALERDLERGLTPVWVKLSRWLDASNPFETFVAQQVPELGAAWPLHVHQGRGRLFLDGLNELPALHAAAQLAQIEQWLQAHSHAAVLASCRQQVLPPKALPMLDERFTLHPLQAVQVRAFIHRYVPDGELGETMFWDLVGGDAFRRAWERRPSDLPEAILNDFVAPQLGSPAQFDWLDAGEAELLANARRDPGRAWPLACTPFLLSLLLGLGWGGDGSQLDELPRRRVDLLARFTTARIDAELEKCGAEYERAQIQQALVELAARLQRVAERTNQGRDAAALALDWNQVDPSARGVLQVALGARLLRREGMQLRFEHQLIHEFYVARYLRTLLQRGAGGLVAHLWPEGRSLWERKGWVQPFLLLAEQPQTDLPHLLATLVEVQPEIAGAVWEQARRRSPHWVTASLADSLAQCLRAHMLPSRHSCEFPLREAAFGRALGSMRDGNGCPLDRRSGVWGWYGGHPARAYVDIEWVRVEPNSAAPSEEPFWVARYPVTNSQFQAFVDDPQGWRDPRWWDGTPISEREAPWTPRWRYDNHPCERVSWWMAVAYCRWLSALLDQPGIGLPSERQWERVAVRDGVSRYPWQGPWSMQFANGDFLLDMTSPVGLFPGGVSVEPPGIHDLSGNVWEWTADIHVDSNADAGSLRHAARGGAWLAKPSNCRVQSRIGYEPRTRLSCLGFRLFRTDAAP